MPEHLLLLEGRHLAVRVAEEIGGGVVVAVDAPAVGEDRPELAVAVAMSEAAAAALVAIRAFAGVIDVGRAVRRLVAEGLAVLVRRAGLGAGLVLGEAGADRLRLGLGRDFLLVLGEGRGRG